ncbi:MAG: CHAD domain-containing protein [Terracidiphilus sp.]
MPSHLSFTGRWPAASPQADWRRQVAAWNKLLAQCACNPKRRHVHALRSLTLRLGATVEFCLLNSVQNPAAARVLQRWNQEGRKLRRALRPVRDADVCLARLQELGAALEENPRSGLASAPCYRRGKKKLQRRLQQRRKLAAARLLKWIKARGKRLKRLGREMAEVVKNESLPGNLSGTPEALRIMAGLAGQFPRLDHANLHAYRKALKPALYLSEISSVADPQAMRLAAALRKTHLAAGEWRDWKTLAEEAGHAGKNSLAPLLEMMAEQSQRYAIALIRRLRLHRVKNLTAAGMPVAAITPCAAGMGRDPSLRIK